MWPKFLRACRACGKSSSPHRARGVCGPCLRKHGGENFPCLPEGLSDAKYDLVESDPRAYVIDVGGKTFADGFDDVEICKVARALFEAEVARWRGEFVDVWGVRVSVDDLPSPQVDEWVVSTWDEDFAALSKRLGVPGPVFSKRGAYDRFIWKAPYGSVRVVISSKAELLLKSPLSRERREFSMPALRAALLDLYDPLSPSSLWTPDDSPSDQ